MAGLPPRVNTILALAGALLLGGVLGLAGCWLWIRNRPPGRRLAGKPHSRARRTQLAMLALLLVLVGVGTVWRSKVALDTVAACRGKYGAPPSSPTGLTGTALVAEKVVTWPETGLGMLYGDLVGASQCLYEPAGYYVDFHSGRYAGSRIVNIGDLTLAPPFDTRLHSGQVVADHEARHRTQWAVGTVMAGPLAFPILYGIDDFFFPGSRNHFERLAGLEPGGYQRAGIAPVIGWPQFVALLVGAALIAILVWRRFRRRRANSSRSDRAPAKASDPVEHAPAHEGGAPPSASRSLPPQ